MRKIAIAFIMLMAAASAAAQPATANVHDSKPLMATSDIRDRQPDHLKMQTFYLDNGLKVIIAEDHSEPKVFGAVIVHAGSKNEDTAATGVAHYFEHIMFKGTDRIGTVDWASEKVLLDSISDAYDRLHATADETQRQAIQMEINRLNVAASKYAIANETDAILQKMGCTGLNAGTSYDYTVYYNTLPSNQLENWMDVYVERFRNPVYRLFQTELEAVYEEKNISDNEQMYTFIRTLFKEAFGEHPYSRDIIGYGHHLKNPQPSQMKVFYDRYYVASNMTLLLVGDLDISTARKMAAEKFGVWPKGEKAIQPKYNMPKFERQIVKKVKQTPLKMGVMIFPGVNSGHPDELPLSVLSNIISGGNGSMDVLTSEGRLLAASLMPLTLGDAGVNAILYLPKLIGQKHTAAEELVWQCLDSVKQGLFSDALLESIKMNVLRSRKEQLESISGIASLLESLELEGSDYNGWIRDNERLQHMTREEIMDVARRYFDRDHCTIIRSSMGFPKKEGAVKPNWEHLEAHNQGAKSEFARMIEERPVGEIVPQVIDFDKDVHTSEIAPGCKMYSSRNPKNDIFTINIFYHYGTFDNRDLDLAMEYFSQLGADSMTLQQFNIELQRLGGSFSFTSSNDFSNLSISGFESNLDAILDLVASKLNNPRHDEQQIKNMVEAMEALKKEYRKDPGSWSSALAEYVYYGDSSTYLNHATIKELKKMKGPQLIAMLQPVFDRDSRVVYVGNIEPSHVASLLLSHNLVHRHVEVLTEKRIRKPHTYNENRVFYCTNPDFVKSDIYFKVESSDFNLDDRATCSMFNEYMGGGMNSVFFQEIREFRALGYSTYGYFSYDQLKRVPPYMRAFLGTQCDKTNDGIEAMSDLIRTFPEREDKFIPARDYLISVRNSDYIGFRLIPYHVASWIEGEKVDHDPRAEITNRIRTMTYDELRQFHATYVAGRPMLILLSGNAKKFNLLDLSAYGKVQQVKYNDMFKF